MFGNVWSVCAWVVVRDYRLGCVEWCTRTARFTPEYEERKYGYDGIGESYS
jgi:hypothetical protein